MAWKDRLLSFIHKYGKAAKVIATTVLNVAAPGSGSLVELVEEAFDTAADTAQDHWEEKLLEATQSNAAELERLGSLVDLLGRDLAKVCDKASAFADQPDDLEDIVRRAINGDRTLVNALHRLNDVTEQFACLQEQNRRLLAGQDEMLPILRRLSRMAEFWEECWTANLKAGDIISLVQTRQLVVEKVRDRQSEEVEDLVNKLRLEGPAGSTGIVLEAGVAVVEGDYLKAQKALATAVKLRPKDVELAEMHRQVTRIVTKPQLKSSSGSTEPSRLQPGDNLDGWWLEARLGAGGWGQVFKASKEGKTRAIKVMHAEFGRDPLFVEQFKREIGNLFRLPRHPNLVQIDAGGFSYAVDRSCWYLIMEYIEGPTLERYLAEEGALTAQQAQSFFAEVAEALGQIHALGICHRDVKPGNLIFRKSDKKLVLVDFGLAVHTEDVSKTTIPGMTLKFASHEQLRGHPADARSDVYSLGAVIYYSLLFDRPDLRDPHCFDADEVPVMLRTALARAMEQNPAKRYAHAGQLREALLPASSVAVKTKTVSTPTLGTALDNPLGMRFTWIPPGEFLMGSPDTDKDAGKDEKPQHKAKIPQPFFLGVHPVTRGEFAHFAKETGYQTEAERTGGHVFERGGWRQDLSVNWRMPGFPQDDQHPVVAVTWNDAQKFIEWLNAKDSALRYRLPTEAEWEYSCRAGTTTRYFTGDSPSSLRGYANVADLTAKKQFPNWPTFDFEDGYIYTSPIGKFTANHWGLHDMIGNVWEWCSDWYGDTWYAQSPLSAPQGPATGAGRVVRGASWSTGPQRCRSAYREWRIPTNANGRLGFRILAIQG